MPCFDIQQAYLSSYPELSYDNWLLKDMSSSWLTAFIPCTIHPGSLTHYPPLAKRLLLADGLDHLGCQVFVDLEMTVINQ